MKKLLVLALTAVLAMNIVGCGKAAEEVTKTEVEAEVTEAVEEEKTAEDDASEEIEGIIDGDVMDLYIEASEASFKAMAESVKDTMEFSVSGEGNTLKYTFKLLVDIGDKETAKASLDAGIPAQEESMNIAISAMKTTGIENPEIILEYLDKDGELISSYNFK